MRLLAQKHGSRKRPNLLYYSPGKARKNAGVKQWQGSGPNSKERIMLTEFDECFPKQQHFTFVPICKKKKKKDTVSEILDKFKYLEARQGGSCL